MNLEARLDKLDELIEELEGDDISLEAAFEKYSEGIKLVKECNESIDRVEKKVRLLMDNGETEDFE
ncbi:MAG: exodeoxyribonuclease VII small subunit [Lachnospiraceae bacterium]|nr:exodeoxyribonuclease VII small subunit [Lachnospiraceae bacterium]